MRTIQVSDNVCFFALYIQLIKYDLIYLNHEYNLSLELGTWCRRQRDLYSMEALSEEQYKKLTEIGFDLNLQKKTARMIDPWTTRLLELKAFQKAHGHTDVPKTFALNTALGAWTHDQRIAYSEDRLTEEQTQALQELGFDFNIKTKRFKLKVWDRNFQVLADYKDRHGSFQGICEDNPKIGEWLKRQKRYYREGSLTQARQDRLKELGVTFKEARKSTVSWETQYEALAGKWCLMDKCTCIIIDILA